jgi:hypothetical protein
MNRFKLTTSVFEPGPISHEWLVNACSWNFDDVCLWFLHLIFVIVRISFGDVGHLVVWQVAVVLGELCDLLVESCFEGELALVLALAPDLLVGCLAYNHLAVDLLVSILKFH